MAVDPTLAPLLGTWRGDGAGTFPTMPDFRYEEEIRFEDLGGDVAYFQRAWDPASGVVLHAEAGIWRATGEGTVVATIAQASRTEVSEGTIRDGVVELATTGTGAAGGVVPVSASRRTYRISGEMLTYEYAMAVRDMEAAAQHLAGTVRRLRPSRS
jgi:THAP4-like, heme-binding beta-barrel domain